MEYDNNRLTLRSAYYCVSFILYQLIVESIVLEALLTADYVQNKT